MIEVLRFKSKLESLESSIALKDKEINKLAREDKISARRVRRV